MNETMQSILAATDSAEAERLYHQSADAVGASVNGELRPFTSALMLAMTAAIVWEHFAAAEGADTSSPREAFTKVRALVRDEVGAEAGDWIDDLRFEVRCALREREGPSKSARMAAGRAALAQISARRLSSA